jgi:hypothetical protein
MDQFQDRISEARALLTQLQALQAENPTDETAKNIELVQKYLKELRDSGLDWELSLMHLRDDIERMIASSDPRPSRVVLELHLPFLVQRRR